MTSKEVKYSRPKDISFRSKISSRAYDFADVIEKHLLIRLKEETEQLMRNCRKRRSKAYVQWFEETLVRNPSLISFVHHKLSKKSKEPIDIFSDEGKYIVGKDLLDHKVRKDQKTVIELRKALGLEHRGLSNESILLTNGIEYSQLFILFGSPLTLEELKANYRTLAKKCHPDVGGSDELMNKITKLYDTIKENWEEWQPSNLAIELDELNDVMEMPFTDNSLRALFSK